MDKVKPSVTETRRSLTYQESNRHNFGETWKLWEDMASSYLSVSKLLLVIIAFNSII